MDKIEEIAIQTYQLNMEYLSKIHPNLHKDLLNFDMAMQNNHYQQQFDLEYINDSFDIKVLQTGKYFYNNDANNLNASYVEHVNNTKNSATIETFALTDTDTEDLKKHIFEAREYIYPMMKYTKNNIDKNSDMKEIVKFIFSGVGLGLHIEKIAQKIKGSRYLIIEDDIEIFKLSLFTTKYYEIAQDAHIFFSVLQDTQMFRKTYYAFLSDAYMYNHLIKYTHLSSHSYVKLKHLISLTSSASFVIFPYQLRLDKVLSPYKYLYNDNKFLNIYKNLNFNTLQNKELLVIASGPSLQKNINWLKENYKKFVIIAVSSSLAYLYKNNITPDIVVSIDQQEIVKNFFTPYKDTDYLKNTTLIFSALTHPNVINSVNKSNLFFTDSSMQFMSEDVNFSYSCVGSFSYLLSIKLQAKNTYVLGLDLAVNQETGSDHIDDHLFSKNIDMSNKTDLPTVISLKDILIPIEGNFHETVYTTPAFHDSINTISEYESKIKVSEQNLYNLNHGARVGSSIALNIDSINTNELNNIDKEEIFNSLKENLIKNSSSSLQDTEYDTIDNAIRTVKKTKKLIEKYSKKAPSSNYDVYIKKLIKLSHDIHKPDLNNDNIITDVYKSFFQYSLSIIYSFFNTKDLKNVKQHIIKFDKLVLDGLNDITRQYEDIIK